MDPMAWIQRRRAATFALIALLPGEFMAPVLVFALFACTPDGIGPTPMLEGPGFFDRPFPGDARMVDGHPDLHDFPLQDEITLLADYVAQAPLLDGFGLASPIWIRFDGPLDTTLLPTPAQSVTTEASVFVVDVDPHSPYRGQRIPLDWSYNADETRWQPADLLAVQPVWGVPLRPATRYALVVTTDIARRPESFDAVIDPESAERGAYQDLVDVLFQLHIDVDDVAVASLFTTQDPVSEMAQLVHRMRTGLEVQPLDQALVFEDKGIFYRRYQGLLRIPIWQHGEAPYTAEGGEFVLSENGWPELWTMDEVEFTFTVPLHDEDMPADGWPVVIYSHGTTGDRLSFANEPQGSEVASMFAKEGLAGFGISLPFHGDRYAGSNVELVSFNYLNPSSGRTAFRQAALEQIWLSEVLTAVSHEFTSDEEDNPLVAHTDPDRIAYMGHSHGAEIGIMAVPFFHDRIRGSVLSSGGGGLSIALLERDAGDFDIQGILDTVLGLEPGEGLTATHPAVGLVQMIAAATDPLHYARYWFAEPPRWSSTPQNVLVFQGLQDSYTPPPTIGALAAAAQIPFLDPVTETWPAQQFVEYRGGDVPVRGNVTAWDGTTVTAGILQYADYGHFTVFEDDGAMKAYQQFLVDALDGNAKISRR
jgi:hypothetical protein